MIREPQWFDFSRSAGDPFCEFEVGGERFEILEPYGDNSRYLIGPKCGSWIPELESVSKAFLDARPFLNWLL